MNEYYLIHHGINGQKWGKRNGPPYPLAYNKHTSAEKQENSIRVLSGQENAIKAKRNKSTFESNQDKKQIRTELTEEQKKELAKRARTIAIAGAAVLGVGVAYTLIHNSRVNSDFILHSGESIYRIASSDSKEMRDVFYAATNKVDAKKYGGYYSLQKIERTLHNKQGGSNTTDIYQKIIKMNSDVKVAGTNTAKKIYQSLAKEDPRFKKTSYEMYNYSLFSSRGNRDFDKKFFKALSDKGYGGLIDYNDAKLSGYTSDRPVILFGQQKNVNVESIKKFGTSDIAKNAAVGVPAIGVQYIGSNPAILATSITSVGFGIYAQTGKKYIEKSSGSLTKKQKDGS